MGDATNPATDDPASLAASLLAEEAGRQSEQRERSTLTVLPDDLLPGVGGERMSMRDTLREGGVATILVICFVVVVEQIGRVALGVLGPDVQTTMGINDTTLVGVASFGSVALVLGAVPLAWLADHVSRRRIVVLSLLGGAAGLALTGLVVNPFQLFWALSAVGFASAYGIPVFGSLMADAYPINGRARIFALFFMAQPLGQLVGPFVVGVIANVAGGREGWRWVYFVAAVPTALLGIAAALFLREPARGHYEEELVLGGRLQRADTERELPVTISTAYQRMKKIKTFYYICVGIGVLGFAFVAVPIQLGLLLKNSYGYGAYTRGWVTSLGVSASIVAIPVAGVLYDRAFRRDPERVVRIAGMLIFGFGLFMVVGLRMHPIALLMGFVALANACTGAAFVGIGPIIGAVAPYRLRAQAFALIPVFIFLMGGFFGGLITGALSDAHGSRTALTIVVPIASAIGGALFVYGARFLKRDISLAVEELLEEQAELQRRSADDHKIPALQVRNLDYSYGPVQVLFDIGFEVQRGEVLALLGTNGAGKSTLLRAISGLGVPDRGVVRLNGRTLTYVETELRFRQGVVQLRGGAGVFPELNVADNLRASTISSGARDRREHVARVKRVVGLFPVLGERMGVAAADLSGGQQQMLALAMALMHEPQLLLIDELSLGLAPLVVQELIDVVGRLRAQGLTIVIVEQSLNVALAVADRAIFLEKGRIRFEGPTRELAERGDLVRAVFLGAEGG
jgi:ABC-type branched-subunit amino acid transport system ATPase component/sugar phosphate permease